MSRSLFALFALLLVLASIARLSCDGGDEAPVTPSAPADAGAPGVAADLTAPGGASPERDSAAHPTPAPEHHEGDPNQDLPLLLAGLVLDAGGAGVPDATVTVERRAVNTGGFGMREVHVQQLPELTVTTDARGRFEVRGEHEGEVAVSAAKEHFTLREEITCSLPATQLTLVLERSGGILATIAPHSLELAKQLYVEVRAPGGTSDVQLAVGAFHGGRALRDGLRPGPYDVVLAGRVSRRPVLTVEGVMVLEGETTRDPRLQDIDLHAVMQTVRVTVVDPDDQPMPGVTVWVHNGSGETGQRTGEDGSLELGAPAQVGIDLSVQEAGWRKVRHRGVVQDLVIRLEAPIAVRLLRPAGRSSALGDLYLYLERVLPEGVQLTGEDTSDWSLPAEQDEVEVGVDAAGRYRVKWAAKFAFGGRGSVFFYPRDIPSQEFEVVEDAGLQEVTLQLDPDAVDELLARTAALTDELALQPGETEAEHERRVIQMLMRESRR